MRQAVLEHVDLLASASDQLKYEADVSIADVPAELVSGFVDDLYQPKGDRFLSAFSEQELKSLAELYGMVCMAAREFNKNDLHVVAEIQKVPEWRSVMAFAKDLAVELRRGAR